MHVVLLAVINWYNKTNKNWPHCHSANTQCTDTCKISNTDKQASSHSDVAKDSGLLECYAVYFPTFRSVVMSTSSRVTWIVDPADEGTTTVRNVDKHSSSDTASHRRITEQNCHHHLLFP